MDSNGRLRRPGNKNPKKIEEVKGLNQVKSLERHGFPGPLKSQVGHQTITPFHHIPLWHCQIYVVRSTPFKEFFTPEALGRFLDSAGVWAPIAYMVVYAVGVCLLLPGTLLSALGAAIFGPYWGFLYVWIGAMIGASTTI